VYSARIFPLSLKKPLHVYGVPVAHARRESTHRPQAHPAGSSTPPEKKNERKKEKTHNRSKATEQTLARSHCKVHIAWGEEPSGARDKRPQQAPTRRRRFGVPAFAQAQTIIVLRLLPEVLKTYEEINVMSKNVPCRPEFIQYPPRTLRASKNTRDESNREEEVWPSQLTNNTTMGAWGILPCGRYVQRSTASVQQSKTIYNFRFFASTFERVRRSLIWCVSQNEHCNSPRAGPYLLLPQSTAVQTKGCPIFKCSKTPKEAALPQRLRHKQQIRNAATLRLPGREQRRQLNRSKSTIKMCCRQINNEAG